MLSEQDIGKVVTALPTPPTDGAQLNDWVYTLSRAIIAAYQAKLLAGVEFPEDLEQEIYQRSREFASSNVEDAIRDIAKQSAAAAAAQARVKALDEAKGACVERMSFWCLSDDRYYEAEDCAYAVEKLKEQP